MSKVPYINYNELEEFYTIKEACKLFELSKAELKASVRSLALSRA